MTDKGAETAPGSGGKRAVPQGAQADCSRVCYLMRGLPSTGKTHTARRLAGEAGIVCETDEFFHTQVGSDSEVFDYDSRRMPEARDWNYARFCEAVDAGISPVVVDRGNGLSKETLRYVRYARDRGYSVELAEPDSEWWAEIRVLLKYRKYTAPILKAWAVKLAEANRGTHRVSAAKIWRRMQSWRHGLRVEDILAYDAAAGEDPGSPPPAVIDGGSEPRSGKAGTGKADQPGGP